jgi:hypothetical protein
LRRGARARRSGSEVVVVVVAADGAEARARAWRDARDMMMAVRVYREREQL